MHQLKHPPSINKVSHTLIILAFLRHFGLCEKKPEIALSGLSYSTEWQMTVVLLAVMILLGTYIWQWRAKAGASINIGRHGFTVMYIITMFKQGFCSPLTATLLGKYYDWKFFPYSPILKLRSRTADLPAPLPPPKPNTPLMCTLLKSTVFSKDARQ